MTLPPITVSLWLGSTLPTPAPMHLMTALRGVEISQRDAAPCGFQLTFLAEIASALEHFDIVGDPLLAPFTRVIVRAFVGLEPVPLIDGIVTHHQFVPSNGPEDSVFAVTGEDLSILLDRQEGSHEFPGLADSAMATVVLAKWSELGIVPNVIEAPMLVTPIDYVPQQAETDREFLQRLARRNGYVFYLTPSEVPGEVTAYWGPPKRLPIADAVIDVAVGPASTADSFSAAFQPLAPRKVTGGSIETEVPGNATLPIKTIVSERLVPLARRPELTPSPSSGRGTMWRGNADDPVTANLRAQGLTNTSTDAVVQASCTVKPERLGQVVSGPGMVGIRGAGEAYDGLYYLKAASHQIDLSAGWDYTQQLTLTREGVGTTTPILEAL